MLRSTRRRRFSLCTSPAGVVTFQYQRQVPLRSGVKRTRKCGAPTGVRTSTSPSCERAYSWYQKPIASRSLPSGATNTARTSTCAGSNGFAGSGATSARVSKSA